MHSRDFCENAAASLLVPCSLAVTHPGTESATDCQEKVLVDRRHSLGCSIGPCQKFEIGILLYTETDN